MTDWERLKFREFRQFVEKSPSLNNSKKMILERMLDEMEKLWESKEVI